MAEKHTLELDIFPGPLPVLIIGTMADLAAKEQGSVQTKSYFNQMEIVGDHSIEVVCFATNVPLFIVSPTRFAHLPFSLSELSGPTKFWRGNIQRKAAGSIP